MRIQTVNVCARLIFSGCALIALASCADTSVVSAPAPPVKVPVPVFVPLPENLLQLCQPKYRYPADAMPVAALEDKIEALELALAMCNNDKELIRAKQPKASDQVVQ
jgi:hypothetical protein